jgi:hypothetical protein
MAAGLRCVALAEADVSNGDDDIPLSASREELEADLRLMGVVALNAPLKVGGVLLVSVGQQPNSARRISFDVIGQLRIFKSSAVLLIVRKFSTLRFPPFCVYCAVCMAYL